jgi:hypothetical protein
MKTTNRKSLLAMALVTSLALPGLALADIWKQPAQNHSGQGHQQQGNHGHGGDNRNSGHGGYDHDRNYGHGYARRDHDDRHEWREHHRYSHGAPVGHYYAPAYYAPSYYAPSYPIYSVYPGTAVSGFYASPSLGLVINLR